MSYVDWFVLLGYLVLVAGLGAWVGRGQKDSDDFLLGGRSIPWWAALLSLVATEISAATFLGAPEQGYLRNLTYLQFAIGSIAAKFVLAHFFISVYYKAGVTTVYEFLARRFGTTTQKITAGLFLFGRLFADGSRLFIAAITIEVVTDLNIYLSIGLLAFITVCYTTAGGIKAVIWTDVMQAVVLVGAGFVLIASLWSDIGLDFSVVWQQLKGSDKLLLIDTSGDPLTKPYHALTAILGGFFLTMATHGTDHDMVQRLLTCKDDAGSRRSTWLSGFVGLVVTILFLCVGLMLFVLVANLPLGSELSQMAQGLHAQNHDNHFVLEYALFALPQGLVGLIVAGVLAAAMSSLSSAFNAMTATFISDFYRPLHPEFTGDQELKASRTATIVTGVLVAVVAWAVAIYWERHPETDLLSLALGVMTFFYGGLLGIFVVAIFTKTRGNTASNGAAAILSTLTVILLKTQTDTAWPWYIVTGTLVALAISLMGRTKPQTGS